MSSYVLHPGAYTDRNADQCFFEFSTEDSLDAADRVCEDIYNTIGNLVPFPQQGHRRPDLTLRPLRFITVRNYLIACAPDENPLLVIAVLHGSRSPRIMAAILRGRRAGAHVSAG